MNSNKFFFFSLIILSIVMGIDWYKHKPTIAKSQKQASQTQETEKKIKSDLNESDEDNENDENEENRINENKESSQNHEQSAAVAITPPQNSDTALEKIDLSNLSEKQVQDPVILAFKNLTRNPFERSPYVKLIDEIKQKENERVAIRSDPQKKVNLPVQLNSNYSGSIKTKFGLKAIINSKVYGIGDDFENKKIKEITPELVVLHDGTSQFLIPKKGVQLKIAQDGSYSTDDTYFKKAY